MSARIRNILIALGLLVIGILVFVFIVYPINGDIGELEKQKDDELVLIGSLRTTLRAYQELQEQGRPNQGRMLELSKMIPDEAEIPSLIIQVQHLSDKSGIEVIQITPGQPAGVEGGGYETMTFALTFTGTFFQTVDFMSRVETMVGGPGRLLTVKSVSLAPLQGGGGTTEVELNVSMVLYAFTMPSQ